VASNQGQGRRSAGLQRLALLAFAALFILLFVVFAVAEGIGNPSVPSGAVAVIEDAPEGLGTVSEDEFQHQLEQAAAAGQIKPVPKPGDKKYDELKETALGEIFDSIWIQGQAEEMGISVTPKEVEAELEKLKKQAFKTEKQYQEFLKEAHYTQADVEKRVKVQIISTQIQEQVTNEAPAPSKSEIKSYYEAAETSQYTQEEKREARSLTFKDEGEAEDAKAELEKDDSVGSWKKVGAKSSNPTAKKSGGLVNDTAEGTAPEPLHEALFAAPQGQVQGPLKTPTGYDVYEVEKITPEKVQSLDEVEPQISNQLAEQDKQQVFTAFVRNYSSRWRSRTFCSSDFLIKERCANFKGDGRPAEANPACYEASPKAPAEACPAPVPQIKPAQPGTISPLTPEGQKLAQRPRPAGAQTSASVPTEALGAPPTGAPEEAPAEAPGE
jgi:parvulin-like peptidyl-prolyl isomerase